MPTTSHASTAGDGGAEWVFVGAGLPANNLANVSRARRAPSVNAATCYAPRQIKPGAGSASDTFSACSENTPMTSATGPRILILALLVLAYALAFQGSRGLFTTDEGRYSAVALNMLESGDFVTPKLSHDVAHFSKPPLTYWAIAASVAVFGGNEWAIRLPNALAFTLTVWLCFAIGKRLDREHAGWAALIYASMALPYLGAHWVSTDTLLSVFETLAALGLIAALLDGERPLRQALLLWVALGLAFVTKGPPGLLGIAALALAALTCPPLRPRIGRLGARWGWALWLAIAAPWFVLLIVQRPDLLDYFLHDEVAARVLSDKHGRSPGFYGLITVYLPTLLLGSLPWGVRLLGALRRPWPRLAALREDPGLWLPLLWFSVPLLVFLLAQSRMPLYLLPLWVPLALLIARTLPPGPPTFSRGGWLLLGLWLAALIALRGFAAQAPMHTNDRALAATMREQGVVAPELVFVEDSPRFGLRLYLGANIERARINQATSRYEQSLADLLAEPPQCRTFIVKPRSENDLQVAAARLGRPMHALGAGTARFHWYRAQGDTCP